MHYWGITIEGWGVLAAWATLFVALGGGVVAIQQLIHAVQTRDEEARAYIMVDFEISDISPIFVNILFRNMGRTAATDVRFRFDPPLQSAIRDNKISETVLLKQGIKFMPPGKTIRALFDRGPDRLDNNLPNVYDCTVSYTDFRGERHEDQLRISLDYFYGLENLKPNTVHDLVNEIKATNKKLDQIAKSMPRGK